MKKISFLVMILTLLGEGIFAQEKRIVQGQEIIFENKSGKRINQSQVDSLRNVHDGRLSFEPRLVDNEQLVITVKVLEDDETTNSNRTHFQVVTPSGNTSIPSNSQATKRYLLPDGNEVTEETWNKFLLDNPNKYDIGQRLIVSERGQEIVFFYKAR